MANRHARGDYLQGHCAGAGKRYSATMPSQPDEVGNLLRGWRARRRLSQLELAGEAEISTRHLSFVECGRSRASRELLLRLAEPLDLPLRERNRLLLAGGYAPLHQETPIDAPDMAAANIAVQAILTGHLPYPALAIDRHWNIVMANDAVSVLLDEVAPELLAAPINALRLSLDSRGLAPRIVNLRQWRQHLLSRLRRDAERSGDPVLHALDRELRALPSLDGPPTSSPADIAVPLLIRDVQSGTTWSFLSATTVFGTAVDITLAELVLECFYPADEQTRRALVERGAPR